MIVEHSADWRERDPKKLIDEMLDRLLSRPRVVSRAEAVREIEQHNPHDNEFGKVTELEAYFLWKTLVQDTGSSHFSGIDSTAGAPNSFAPVESIRCIRDTVRTKKFMAAVRKAVEAAAERQEIVEVCDAGSGALPIMGIYGALSSPKARVTCLENNPHAVQFARATIAAFGLNDRVTIEQCDATKYVPQRTIDVLVSETMDTALIHEPLCAIVNHLTSYTAQGAAIIPRSVETFAALVPARELDEAQQFVHLAGSYIPHLNINWIKTGRYVPGADLREIGAILPVSLPTREPIATLITSKITVGADTLDIYDSIISTPQSVQANRSGGFERRTLMLQQGQFVRIAYAPGTDMKDIHLTIF